MSGIFLSYRRDDASGWAGRLYEHLVREVGPEQVFIDIDTIAPGEDFRKAIELTMDVCDVVMVVIGPSWLTARDEAGNRRLEDERDTHRAEVLAALTADVRVVPLLVGGAKMPQASELPEPLKGLSYRNAAVVEDRRFAADVSALVQTLRRAADNAYPSGEETHRPPSRTTRGLSTSRRGGALPWEAILAGAGTVIAVVWGLLLDRWHDEYAWIAILATVTMLAGACLGAWVKQWMWVLGAGITGLGGLVLWLLQLVSTHPTEVHEIFGLSYDGFENGVALLGATMVLVAGIIGVRREPGTREDFQR